MHRPGRGVRYVPVHDPDPEPMPDERRYRADEVDKIFELATTTDPAHPAGHPARTDGDARGLTLAELQEVGREVGVDPARIVGAAHAIEAGRGALPRQISLGMPIGVGRVIGLPRALTDDEWTILVGELRSAFGAAGHLTADAHGRAWSNGNLRAALERSADGHRLHLSTRMGDARFGNALGVTGLAVGSALLALVLSGTSPAVAEMAMLWSFAAGIGSLTWNALRLPRWARKREGQMAYIADRVRSLLSS